MSGTIQAIGLLAGQNIFLAYFIIYVATIFLGNISAFVSFWFIVRGYFGPWGVPLLVLTIYLSNVTGDILWYSLGRTLHDTRLGAWVKNRIPAYEKAEAIAAKNGRFMMFFAKFLYASSFPIIFSLGWIRMNFGKFIRTSALSALLWLPVLFGISYGIVSGLSPLAATTFYKDFEWFFLVGLASFLILNYAIARIFQKIFYHVRKR